MSVKVLLLGAAIILGSCDDLGPRACTLVGCTSGVTINVPASVPFPFTLTLSVPGGSPIPLQVNCTAQTCQRSLFIAAFLPDYFRAELKWTVDGRPETTVRDFRPEYVETRPNGRGCEPTCRQGTVSF